MLDLIVFCLLGLLAGAAARLGYAGREPMKVLGTMLLGTAGALVGGLISWAVWPAVDGQLYFGALLMSLFGAVFALVSWPVVTYAGGQGRLVGLFPESFAREASQRPQLDQS